MVDVNESSVLPDLLKEDCIYTKCYCEENVWKLCESLACCQQNRAFAVFISNHNKSVPLWSQTAGDGSNNGLVIWDYHVILLILDDSNSLIYDLDSTLPFPCPLESYISETFHPEHNLKEKFQQMLRLIPAEKYLSTFASDRSHMIKDDGSWLATPPHYPCIETSNSKMNIDKFWSMSLSGDTTYGEVYTLQKFIESFLKNSK